MAQNIRMGGPWDETEKALHINALELKAAEFGLKSLTKDKTDIHVHLKMDNVSAVAHINRMGGTRSPILLKISREIWEYCLQRGITLTAEYIPGVLNEIADWESRHTESSNNWTLNRAIFQQINKIMGSLKLDLFVDRLNAQLDNYVSWRPDPFAIQTDAFQVNWSNKNPYAFPHSA